MGQMLVAADMLVGPMREIVIVGDPDHLETARALADLRHRFLPNQVTACRAPDRVDAPGPLQPAFRGKTLQASEPTIYVCENFACQAPVSGPDAGPNIRNEASPR
jgi:uncharacterized protein